MNLGTLPQWLTLVGITLCASALRAAQCQRILQFENLFVQRYWTLIDRLSLTALSGDSNGKLQDDDNRIIRAYFRLCEDELELRKSGWISDSTWKMWRVGMFAHLRRWPFSELWQHVNNEVIGRAASVNDAEFSLLRSLLDEKLAGDDPCALSGWRRWLAGLSGGMPV